MIIADFRLAPHHRDHHAKLAPRIIARISPFKGEESNAREPCVSSQVSGAYTIVARRRNGVSVTGAGTSRKEEKNKRSSSRCKERRVPNP
jgi:hypothetical protein